MKKMKNMKKMKCYISGKIGEEVISEATRQKFAKAEAMLKAKGYEVFNPASEEWQRYVSMMFEIDRIAKEPWLEGEFPDFYGYIMLRDLMVLSTKDIIFMLEDWKDSEGAGIEYKYAKATKKKVLFSKRKDAEEYLWSECCKKRKVRRMGLSDGIAACEEYTKQHINEVWLPL